MNSWPRTATFIDFPGRNAGEHLQFYFRHHWIRSVMMLLRTVIFTVLILLGGWALFPLAPEARTGTWHPLLLILIGCLCILQLDFLLRFYGHFLRLVIISDQSIHRIRKTLVAFDDHEVIDLASLQDVQKVQNGVLQNMLGYGTIVLKAQHSIMKIHFTPNIARTHRWIMELREEARRRSTAANSVYDPPVHENRPTR